MDLRCEGTLHGRVENGIFEAKCHRRSCGYEPGMVLLHYIDITTGELLETKRYADPRKERKINGN
jgi:hypothetical protein